VNSPIDIPAIAAKAAQIEAEMRRIGQWSDKAPRAEQFQSKTAFFADTMSFGQWLQFVFLPRVHEVIDGKSPAPASSMVGTYAVREFDGFDEAQGLASLLAEFDALIH
jgi:uncharacterized protein YqcC (DUF446 family)